MTLDGGPGDPLAFVDVSVVSCLFVAIYLDNASLTSKRKQASRLAHCEYYRIVHAAVLCS